MDFGKAVFLEEHRHLLAAAAVVADRDHGRVGIELTDARRHLAHRNVLRALDARLLPFPRLAHVEQHGLRAPCIGEPGGELGCGDLFQNRNLGACSALTSGAITVSKRSVLRHAPGRLAVTRRALITGASPTTAKRRPPGASCSTSARGRIGVEPVSTMTS